MVAAEILIALVEPPGNGEAGNDAADEILRFMRTKHGHAAAVEVAIALRAIERPQALVPASPLTNEMIADQIEIFLQGGNDLLSGFPAIATETERQDELAIAGGEIDFASEGKIAIFGASVVPGKAEVLREILPAIGVSDEPHRACSPRRGAGEPKGDGVALGK